jgi:hypothetical protein
MDLHPPLVDEQAPAHGGAEGIRAQPVHVAIELEEVVSAYHLGRQQTRGSAVCCDVETRERCACDGWNQFDNAAIEKFCLQITGSRVAIG